MPTSRLAALATLLLAGTTAGALASPLTIASAVGGAATGAIRENFDSLSAGAVSPQALPSGITLSFVADAAVVQGNLGGKYAAPFLSNNNGNGFGSPNQANGADTTTYLTTGSTGSNAGAAITLTLPALEKYFGLLWGSVDSYNTLSFYNGGTLVGAITGANVIASPNGNQGANGTTYVNITSTVAFNRVVATSSAYAFEFDNVAFNPTGNVGVPEPASLGLLGAGLLGLRLASRRKPRAA